MTFEALPDDLPAIPILLRDARGAFAGAIATGLASAGLPALPTNGPLILRGLHEGGSLTQLVTLRQRSIDRFQTIEKLREAGYLSGPEDDLVLSERGHQAAHVIFDAIRQLTTSLHDSLGDDGMRSFVKGLLFLSEEQHAHESAREL